MIVVVCFMLIKVRRWDCWFSLGLLPVELFPKYVLAGMLVSCMEY
jgi:hypothetical protein